MRLSGPRSRPAASQKNWKLRESTPGSKYYPENSVLIHLQSFSAPNLRDQDSNIGARQVKFSMKIRHKHSTLVGFGVLRALIMKGVIFWDMMAVGWLNCFRNFGGMYRLYLQGRGVSQSKSPMPQATSKRKEAKCLLRITSNLKIKLSDSSEKPVTSTAYKASHTDRKHFLRELNSVINISVGLC
jgi:hypothetical protein